MKKLSKKSQKETQKNQTPLPPLDVQVVDHPILLHKLGVLRNKAITSMAFRQIVEEMSQLLAFEATRELKMRTIEVITPLEKTRAFQIRDGIVLVAIMRAGMGMLNGMMRILPFAQVGHIGIYRDKFVHATVEYYLRLPRKVKEKRILLLDPMLATGDTACAAIERLKQYHVGEITLITLIAAPIGVRKVNAHFPDVKIVTVSLERELNKKGYILPGMGDAGDRLYEALI